MLAIPTRPCSATEWAGVHLIRVHLLTGFQSFRIIFRVKLLSYQPIKKAYALYIALIIIGAIISIIPNLRNLICHLCSLFHYCKITIMKLCCTFGPIEYKTPRQQHGASLFYQWKEKYAVHLYSFTHKL